MKLYELVDKYQQLEEVLESLEEGDDTQEVIASTLDSIEGAIEEKVEALIRIKRNYEAEAEKFKEEKKRLEAKEKTLQHKAESIHEYMADMLAALGLNAENKRKIEAGLWKVGFQANSQPSVVIEDEGAVPQDYIQYEPKFDRKGMIEAWKNGQDIPGVVISKGQHLRIR